MAPLCICKKLCLPLPSPPPLIPIDGPDNGAWQCSGNYDYANLPPPYPALNESEIASFCAGENAVQAAAHEWLFANGGMDGQACWEYPAFPLPSDTPSQCAAKLLAANHYPSQMPVGWGMDRTGQKGWSDSTSSQTVASFLLVRGDYWFLGAGGNGVNDFTQETAALLLSDWGNPTGNMTNSSSTLFTREYERMTVSLDCSNFTASFVPA